MPFSQIMAAEEMQLYPPPFVACTYRILIVFVHVNHRCFYVISVDFFLQYVIAEGKSLKQWLPATRPSSCSKAQSMVLLDLFKEKVLGASIKTTTTTEKISEPAELLWLQKKEKKKKRKK